MPISLQWEYLLQRAVPTLHFYHAEKRVEQCFGHISAFICSAPASWQATPSPAYSCFPAYTSKKTEIKTKPPKPKPHTEQMYHMGVGRKTTKSNINFYCIPLQSC